MSKLMHSSLWNIRFNASHSGSYSNALDLHPNVPPSDGKMAQYAPLSPPPLPRVSSASSKTVKLLAKNFCFNKVKIDRKLYDLEKEAPQNHADYLNESVNKV